LSLLAAIDRGLMIWLFRNPCDTFQNRYARFHRACAFLTHYLAVFAAVFLAGALVSRGAETLYIGYNNADNYVEEYSSTNGVNTDLGPLPSTTTRTSTPNGVALDAQGNLYVSNDGNNTITKFGPGGTYLGIFASGLNQPAGMKFDAHGNLFVANVGNGTISEITPGGAVTTAVASGLSDPEDVAFDAAGNLYVANLGDNSVKKITPQGQMSNFYQDPSWVFVSFLQGLAFDPAGNLYVTSYRTNGILKITPAGAASLFLNNGNPDYPTDQASLYNPMGLAFDSAGNLFVANFHYAQVGSVREISYIDEFGPNGALINEFTNNANLPGSDVTLRQAAFIAISGSTTASAPPAEGLQVSSTSAFASVGGVSGPYTPVSDSYVVGNTGTVSMNWKAAATQSWLTISTPGGSLAGGGSVTVSASINSNATALGSGTFTDTITFTDQGTGFTQTEPVTLVIIPAPAISSALTASGTAGMQFSYQITASNGPASFAAAGLPNGLSINPSTGIISGTATGSGPSNVTISAINAGGTGSATLALNMLPSAPAGAETLIITYTNGDSYVEEYSSVNGVNTDIGTLPNTTLYTADPNGIARDTQGNIYIANDATNNITKFDANGNYIGIFASGLSQPAGMNFDSAGNLYVVSGGTVVKITPGGVQSIAVGSGLNVPQDVAFDAAGNMYVTDQGSNSVKKITPQGQMSTFYQDGSYTIVNQLEGLAFDSAGNLYIAGYQTDSIEKITPAGVATQFANNGDPNNPTNPQGIYNPIGLTFDSAGNLFVMNYHHTQVPGFEYEGHGISYVDEYASNGTLISSFTNNPSIPGSDPNLRDANYMVIVGGTGAVAPEGLQLSSTSSFASSGAVGGPFVPASDSYVVGNSSTSSMAWSAAATQSWLSLSSNGGTLGANGSVTVTASINSNANALASGTYTDTITFKDQGTGFTRTQAVQLVVIPAPVITSALAAVTTSGVGFTYQITASNGPGSFGAGGLPTGLSVNTATGLISGTAAASGTSNVTISASGPGGSGIATLVLTVLPPPPVITSTLAASATAGSLFAYQIAGSNGPTSFNASGLPAGLNINTLSGAISGIPGASGTSNVTITAANVSGTGSATLVLTVLPPPPVITSPATASATAGSAFTYQIAGSNGPASFNASGLPAGLNVNTSTGIISGTASASGTSTVTISAANVTGTGSATLVLTVLPPPPVITSTLAASGTAGSAFSYQIAATNTPTSFNASGLPAGLSVNTATGLVSGTATNTGTSSVTITAANVSGTGSATLVLKVLPPPPVISSTLTASATAGSAFTYQIAASNSPTSFNATGLPGGLSVNTATGLVSGTATATGTSNVTITAANVSGTGSATLVLAVLPPPPVITSPASASGTAGSAFT
jgi:sugar lactone lactonase YvrE